MINERVMAQGSYDVRFSLEAPLSLWTDLARFGHILITPQWVDHRLLDDATMLAASRYTGVILKKQIDENGFQISGAGLTWWLGDEEGKGDLLPAAITKGTVTEPPGTTYTGEHQWETPLEAIRTVAASTGTEYRINPDGTIDMGPNNSVYNIDDADMTVVVVRTGRSGGDSLLRGIDVDSMKAELDSRSYATRGIVTTVDSNNVETLVGSQDRTPAPTETDLFGNLIDRTILAQTSGTPVEVTLYLTTLMNEHAIVYNMEISTEFYEIQNGSLRIGDAFWAYDPPAFVDTDNEIWFRGEPINPRKLRLIAASWPLRPGMGVYYRPPIASPVAADFIDVTSYIQWEDASRGRLGVRV